MPGMRPAGVQAVPQADVDLKNNRKPLEPKREQAEPASAHDATTTTSGSACKGGRSDHRFIPRYVPLLGVVALMCVSCALETKDLMAMVCAWGTNHR